MTINIHEAKTHRSRLLVRVEMGEEIILARAAKTGRPLAPRRLQRPAAAGNRGQVLAIGILLDTRAFLWAITDDRRLTRHARRILETADLFLSVARVWEIITKVQIGKLPLHHRDLFDRMLVAQSLEEKLPLLSCDVLLAPYGADIRWE